MTVIPSACPLCETIVPAGSSFCPGCGAATPTEISGESGVARSERLAYADQDDHRRRLQALLGSAYEIRYLVGRGGFAEVYAAWDARLKREVAVKTLRYDLPASRTLLDRFRREAEAVAKLRHPNIVPIYDVGSGRGLAYFIMPLIDGRSLAAVLAHEVPLSVAEACRILVESARALGVAHAAGIVHRDIKPDNIMIEGPERRALLMDFGIAKALDSLEESLTTAGAIVGTPHYLSPEQAGGGPQVSDRSDQYSLAIVGYRVLTGQLPFVAEGMPQIIYKHIFEQPVSVHERCPEVPREISEVIARAMAKSPDDRFPSIGAFATALAGAARALERAEELAPALAVRVTTGETPATRHPAFTISPPPPVPVRAARRPAALAAGIVFALTLGVATVWLTSDDPAGPPAPSTGLEGAPDPQARTPPMDTQVFASGTEPRPALADSARPQGTTTAATPRPEPPPAATRPVPAVPAAPSAGPSSVRIDSALSAARAHLDRGRQQYEGGAYLPADSAFLRALRALSDLGLRVAERRVDSLRTVIGTVADSNRKGCETIKSMYERRGRPTPACP